MFLQFCGKTEVNWVSAITNAEHHHTTTPELRKCERNVGPTLRGLGFKISLFQMPNIDTQQLPNCEKVKGTWDQHFGVLGFRILRLQMPNINTQQLLNCKKVKGMWDQHFGVSGFGISRFQMPNITTQQLPNCEKVKGKWDQHFGVSGFITARELKIFFPSILGSVLPPHICYLSILPRSFSLPWEFSQLSKSLIFRAYQWPKILFATCNNKPRGSSNMFPTQGVMVS
jgi:hypothetical protein